MSSVLNQSPAVLSASSAIPLPPGARATYHITVAGVGAFTLAAPDRDGQEVVVIDETAHAHTIAVGVASPPSGLNGGGSTTITFNGTKGSSVALFSRNGSWWSGLASGTSLS